MNAGQWVTNGSGVDSERQMGETQSMDYVIWLLGLSVAVAALERWFAARNQKVLRTWLWSDAIHLVFNAHIFGLLLYAVAHDHILPHFDSMLIARGWQDALYFNAADNVGLGLLSQSILALVVIDFVQWVVHNLLHRFSFLWRFHQVHHSVQDGEMDWMVSFRFSWFESNVLTTDEGWHRVGDRVVLDITDPEEVAGQDLIIRVTAAMGEQTWSDERRVRVIDEG